MKPYYNLEDTSQIIIGPFAVVVPVSFSEEAWDLGGWLPLVNLLLIVALSILFLAFFTYESVFQGDIQRRVPGFVARLFLAYFIAGGGRRCGTARSLGYVSFAFKSDHCT